MNILKSTNSRDHLRDQIARKKKMQILSQQVISVAWTATGRGSQLKRCLVEEYESFASNEEDIVRIPGLKMRLI